MIYLLYSDCLICGSAVAAKLIYLDFPKKIINKLLHLIHPRELWGNFVEELVVNSLNILHTCRDGGDDYNFIAKIYILSREMS